jgi:hypothetical protein
MTNVVRFKKFSLYPTKNGERHQETNIHAQYPIDTNPENRYRATIYFEQGYYGEAASVILSKEEIVRLKNWVDATLEAMEVSPLQIVVDEY